MLTNIAKVSGNKVSGNKIPLFKVVVALLKKGAEGLVYVDSSSGYNIDISSVVGCRRAPTYQHGIAFCLDHKGLEELDHFVSNHMSGSENAFLTEVRDYLASGSDASGSEHKDLRYFLNMVKHGWGYDIGCVDGSGISSLERSVHVKFTRVIRDDIHPLVLQCKFTRGPEVYAMGEKVLYYADVLQEYNSHTGEEYSVKQSEFIIGLIVVLYRYYFGVSSPVTPDTVESAPYNLLAVLNIVLPPMFTRDTLVGATYRVLNALTVALPSSFRSDSLEIPVYNVVVALNMALYEYTLNVPSRIKGDTLEIPVYNVVVALNMALYEYTLNVPSRIKGDTLEIPAYNTAVSRLLLLPEGALGLPLSIVPSTTLYNPSYFQGFPLAYQF